MLQRLPIALAQIKAGNNSESLLNQIRQIVHCLHQPKEITKKVYNNLIKSIKIQYKKKENKIRRGQGFLYQILVLTIHGKT